jgi:hypothetical protein
MKKDAIEWQAGHVRIYVCICRPGCVCEMAGEREEYVIKSD